MRKYTGVQGCSKLVRSFVLDPETEDWGMENAMTYFVACSSAEVGCVPYDVGLRHSALPTIRSGYTKGMRKLVQSHFAVNG